MAILLISNEYLRDEAAMKIMRNHFDEFIRIEKGKYFVYKPGLPEDNTKVNCILNLEDGVYTVQNVIITGIKI